MTMVFPFKYDKVQLIYGITRKNKNYVAIIILIYAYMYKKYKM